MIDSYLGLGSNIGDSESILRDAVEKLKKTNGIGSVDVSSIYRTAPVGGVLQDDFANAVVRIATSLGARELLDVLLNIETEFNRVRVERWGPRTLDIDLLLYGGENIAEESLRVPHPRMLERAFVLAPLAELEPDLVLNGKAIAEWLAKCSNQRIQKW